MNENPSQLEQLEELKAEHRLLDEQIKEMLGNSSLNQLELARMKRRKLHLKDQIQLMIDRNVPDIIA